MAAAGTLNNVVLYQSVIMAVGFAVAAFAGLAAYLRTAKSASWIGIFSALANGGCMGIAVCGFCYWKWESPSIPLVFGACSLIGLGGIEMVNFVLGLVRTKLETASSEEKKS